LVKIRTLILGVLVFSFFFGVYMLIQVQFGRSYLLEEGIQVGRVLSIELEKVTPNFMFNYGLKFERPDLVEDRLCWLVRFEQRGRTGHYVEVWIDFYEALVVGGVQCR